MNDLFNGMTTSDWKKMLSMARYWVRKDESVGISFGDPTIGPHQQFDFNGSESLAKVVVTACKSWAKGNDNG